MWSVVSRLIAIGLLSGSAAAQTNTPGIDSRQTNQQQRIDQGVRSGSLNSAEAARLKKGQANVQSLESKAKADGRVTAAEREAIRDAQNRQDQRIRKQKHDGQTR
jgi:hypothetical protein